MPLPIDPAARHIDRGGASAGPPPPEPGFFETIGAGFTASRADTTGYVEQVKTDKYSELVDQLSELGYPVERYIFPSRSGVTHNFQRIFEDARKERARGHFANLPGSMAEFDEQWQTAERTRIETAEATASRGGMIPGFIGGVAGAMTDPVNVLTLPLGGAGKTIATRVIGEGLINMGIETALQPVIADQRTQLGRRELTLEEAGQNIIFAGAAGVTIRGTIELTPKLAGAARGTVERSVAKHWDRLPDSIRERWTQNTPLPDSPDFDILLADTTEQIIGAERLSETEAASVEVLRSEGNMALANPFANDGVGLALHDKMMSDTLARLIATNPTAPRPAAAPGLAPSSRPALAGSTSIASEVVPAGSRGRFMQRVRGAESSGDDGARATTSSAYGRYQFIKSTWLTYYKRRFGAGGLSDAAILAKRGDGRLQEALMGDLTADNEAALRAAGITPSEGNLYLAHFAGSGGARKLHQADPSASARSVMGDAAVNANRFLENMNAGQVIAWAHRKMGGEGAPATGGGARISPDRVREDDLRAQMQEEIDQLAQESAALEAELARDPNAPDVRDLADDAEVVPIDPIDPEILTAPREEPNPGVPAETQALLPALRERLAGKESISDMKAMSDRLGASEDELRQALTQMALRGEIAMIVPRTERARVKNGQGRRRWQSDAEVVADRGGVWNGNFMRKPPAPARGPRSIIEFISDRGGIWDGEGGKTALGTEKKGDFASMGLDEWHKAKPFRRSAIRDPKLGAGINGGDTLFRDLVDEGYFPEYRAAVNADGLDELDGPAILRQAIEAELSGNPRYVDDLAAASEDIPTRGPKPGDEEWEYYRGEVEDQLYGWMGFDPGSIAPETLDELVDAFVRSDGGTIEDTMFDAVNVMADRSQMEAIAQSRDADYEYIDYEPPYSDRSAAGGQDIPTAEDIARFEPVDPNAPEGGVRGEGAGTLVATGRQLADLAPDERAPMLDPDGAPAKAQADSLAHDARQAVLASEALRKAKLRPTDEQIMSALDSGLNDGWSGTFAAMIRDMGDRTGIEINAENIGRFADELGAIDLENRGAGFTTRDIEDWVASQQAAETVTPKAGPFDQAKAKFDRLMAAVDAASEALQQFPKGAMGLTPDAVKASPEFRAAKARFEDANAAGKKYAGPYNKRWKAEIAAERNARRALQQQPVDYFAAIRDLPDTDASVDIIMAERSRIWRQAEADGNLDEVIGRYDDARDQWEQQFEASRATDDAARQTALKERSGQLATAIADSVNAGTAKMTLFNGVQKRSEIYGAGTVRVVGGTLQVASGSKWNAVPGSQLEEVAASMGIKLPDAQVTKAVTPAASAPPALRPVLDQSNRPMADFGDRLFRETSIENAMFIIPEGASTRGISLASDSLYLSNVPELAKGQGDNRGVMLEFGTEGLNGRADLSKPSARMMAEQGHYEIIYRDGDKSLGKALRAITIAQDAESPRALKMRMNGVIKALQKKGWILDKSQPNQVRISAPDASAPAAKLDNGEAIDPAVAERARQENQLRADQPLRGARKTGAAQDGAMPEGLFGGPEQPTFRLSEEGEPQDLQSLLDDIDAEAADLKNITDCL